LKLCKSALNESTLDSILEDLDCDTCRTLLWGKETGHWLSVMPSTLNSTKLSSQEFQDSLDLHYTRTPGDLPTHYNALKCKVGGLIIMWHNEVNDELADLASKAMTSSAIWAKPLISKGSTNEEAMASAAKQSVQHIPYPNSHSVMATTSVDFLPTTPPLLLMSTLWTRTLSPIVQRTLTRFFLGRNVFHSIDTLHLLSSPQTDWSAAKQRSCSNDSLCISQTQMGAAILFCG
jgi:hypothetical protein